MRAVGYVRVSTEDQAASGLGLEAQRMAIAAAAKRLGTELGPVFADEGLSGSLPPLKRPELVRALEQLVAGDVLLVAKRDRLARDHLEIGLLERALKLRKVRVVSAAGEGTESDDPIALFLRAVLDAVGELERNMAIKRTRDALAAKRARGERSGSIPFGYELGPDDKLVEVLEEQVAIALISERRALGEGYRAIARTLTSRSFKPRGRAWHPSSVRSILDTLERRKA